jgi:hypothetical protein
LVAIDPEKRREQMSQGKPKKLKNYIENEVKLDLEGLIEESDVSSEYPIP